MNPPPLWIIGASSRVSRELALRAAREGWPLLVAGRDAGPTRAVGDDLQIRSGTPVQSAAIDLTRVESIVDFCTTALASTPPRGIFIAAGLMPSESDLARDPALFARMAAANYTGVVQLIDRMLPHLAGHPGAFISVVTSVAGDRGRASNFRYGSTKAALSTYLEGLRAAAPEGLLIQDVKLGPVDTPMNTGNTRVPFMISPERAAGLIWKALHARRSRVYVPGLWRWIMTVIRLLPPLAMRKLPL